MKIKNAISYLKPTKKEIIRYAVEVAIVAVLLCFDLLSKHFVVKALPVEGDSVVAIKGFLTFIYCRNTGASFSVFSNSTALLTAISVVLCVVLIAFLFVTARMKFSQGKWGTVMRVAVILILSGGLGNLVDRLAFGYVRDFIYYQFLEDWFGIHFAICNVADVELSVGMVMLVVYVIFSGVLRDKKAEEGAIVNETEGITEASENSSENKDSCESIIEEPSLHTTNAEDNAWESGDTDEKDENQHDNLQ